MRKTDFILLIFGFLWLACSAFSVVPLTRAVGMQKYKEYDAAGAYSGRDVVKAIHDVLTEYQDESHRVFLPACLMLAGGVLLDRARRGKVSGAVEGK